MLRFSKWSPFFRFAAKIVSRPIHATYPTHPTPYDTAAIVKEKHQTGCTWGKSWASC